MEPQRLDPTAHVPASCANEGLTGSEEANNGRLPPHTDATEEVKYEKEAWSAEPEPRHEHTPLILPQQPWGRAESAA